jgi:arylsulfatase A-like enzyme
MSRRLLVAGALLAAGCTRPPGVPTDLIRTEAALLEAALPERDKAWVLQQSGKPLRLADVVRQTVPATPPSRLRYRVTVPRDGRLTFACGLAPEAQEGPAVEFAVGVVADGVLQTAWSRTLDPAHVKADRRWVPDSVELGRFAGESIELILSTRAEGSARPRRRVYWGNPALAAPHARAPLVVLFLTDTLRADHTTVYGYERATTPHLADFAKDAAVFEQAIAQASWTKPSVASIFTSLLPGRHRVVQLRDPLDPALTTIAEMLAGKGFTTGASIGNSVIYLDGHNFDQGFEYFGGVHGEDDKPSKDPKAKDVVDGALQWLDARAGFPAFLYVHTMDPHVPYTPPPPFDTMFKPRPLPDRGAADPRTDYKEPDDLARIVAQYDGDVAYNDQEFGRLIAELKARELYDEALIVFVADHGEEFQDHGQWFHGRSVFDELVRIPLVVKFPRGLYAGRRVPQQVQEVDLLPTILETLGLPVPAPPALAGRPLQGVLSQGASEPPAISEISHRGIVALGVRTAKDKYVQRFSPEEDELYFDLVADPLEKTNRIEQGGERVRWLRASLDAAMTRNPFRHNLRFNGPARFEVTVRTRGWIDRVEVSGFALDDRHETLENGRRLTLLLKVPARQTREVAFSVRPNGVPVLLEGTQNGRPLRTTSVFVGPRGSHPERFPYPLPQTENENERASDAFAAPEVKKAGVLVWLTPDAGRQFLEFDQATCEQMKALGYVGQCSAGPASGR